MSGRVLLATVALAGVAQAAMEIMGAPIVRAQTPVGAASFEVASVKQNRSGDLAARLESQPGGRLTAINTTAAALIRFAYDLPVFQVSGGPDWLRSDRFDVVAKSEGDPPVAEKRTMLRVLL